MKSKRYIVTLLIGLLLTAWLSQPTAAKEPITLIILTNISNVGEYQKFEDTHPGIKIDQVWPDKGDLIGYIRQKNPDLALVSSDTMTYLIRSSIQFKDLRSMMQHSQVLPASDLHPVQRAGCFDPRSQKWGVGPQWAYINLWTPAANLWINKDVFKKAGIPIPSDKSPLSWNKVMDYAKRLTIIRDDRVEQVGLWVAPGYIGSYCLEYLIRQMLATCGKDLYSPDFKEMHLKDPDTIRALQLILGYSKLVASEINIESADAKIFQRWDIKNGRCAMSFVPTYIDLRWKDKLICLPAPTLGYKRVNPAIPIYGFLIPKIANHPNEAWQLVEWLMTSPQSSMGMQIQSGLGGYCPASNRLMKLLLKQMRHPSPQMAGVIRDEQKRMTVLGVNPYQDPYMFNMDFHQLLVENVSLQQWADRIERQYKETVLRARK